VLDKSGYDSPEEYKARVVYYDHITNKAIAADATDAQKAIVTFGPWTPVGGTSNDAITLSDAEKAKVADEVKKANPTAKDIKVNKDGSVVVTFEDGTTAAS